ncbi:uncharacterized protein VICG_00884 [Vittaforma corneae ATCC 50505]|uniref:Uncharacterized protein n=1 Tax=Vittaforma corneae (strain ATCC 50505) TaxID=993615 RepID=L2GNY9_VITCO|nr:uncharacterized protein VICG_00884 [Vittaforma corneae ATCC 50505]ELA42037.1 hypothetical protein VICG_00884 [Vittaforma corneae ATCC 50505]
MNEELPFEHKPSKEPISLSEPTTFEVLWNAASEILKSLGNFLYSLYPFILSLKEDLQKFFQEYYKLLKDQYNNYKSYLNEDNRKEFAEAILRKEPKPSYHDYLPEPFVSLSGVIFLFFFVSYFFSYVWYNTWIDAVVRISYPMFSTPLIFLLIGDALEEFYLRNENISYMSCTILNGSFKFRLCVILHLISLCLYVGKFGQAGNLRKMYFIPNCFILCYVLYLYYSLYLVSLFDRRGYITILFLFQHNTTRLNLLQAVVIFGAILLVMVMGRVITNFLLIPYINICRDNSKANAEAEHKEKENKDKKDKEDKEKLKIDQDKVKKARKASEDNVTEFLERLKKQSDNKEK